MADSREYYFKDTDGDSWIDVADDTFFTDDMSYTFNIGNVYVQFYDANKDPVTPGAGTITIESSPFPDAGHYLQPPTNGVINAVDVIAGTALYTPPSFDSVVYKSRLTLSGITGATYMKAFHWRSKG